MRNILKRVNFNLICPIRLISTRQALFIPSRQRVNMSYPRNHWLILPNRSFATNEEKESIIDLAMEEEEGPAPALSNKQTRDFKSETKKLLGIVANSIYTDKEVFLRELLSNCSDALEKQRYHEINGTATMSEQPLYISITVNEKARTITIFDSGIGMTKEETINNLGTIAHSGSEDFLKNIGESTDFLDSGGSLIGQFGLGFYSSFIVADTVETFSKTGEDVTGVHWVSDGTGNFDVSDCDNLDFKRGTKIVLHLKHECRHFAKERELDTIIKKYSLFISYPIKLNGDLVNNLQAIWYRSKREVSEEEYEKFYEHASGSKIPYKFKVHYSTDVPLSIKAILYAPSTHGERKEMQMEKSMVSLYSRKVLIKQNCQELFPNYLRFVKGVVDCEDLPLNISRENYQDSGLIGRLRNVLTRRLLKLFEEEMKADLERYQFWYDDFQIFLKEGLATDQENSEMLLKLMRYQCTFTESTISLEDYVKHMTKDQNKIYFLFSPKRDTGMNSPYMESFRDSETPVLLVDHHVDEMCFKNIDNFKGYKFINIESHFDEISKDVKSKVEIDSTRGLPEDDITPFCLWLKNELADCVSKVTVSKRLKDTPAIVVSQLSSSMRQMMAMMDPQGLQSQNVSKEQNLEINPNHPLLVKINLTRKRDPEIAKLCTRLLFDNVLNQAGIPSPTGDTVGRTYKLMETALDLKASQPVPKPLVAREKYS